jgi:hypothetical protein
VAVPSEHGGWGLTIEPVVLGLLVRPSLAGLVLGLAALVVFLARTPLKIALVDRRRERSLARTRLAGRIAAVEVLVFVGLLVVIVVAARSESWWIPILAASPLATIDMWFELRSRGRRLVPELAGTAAISAVAPAIVTAAGGPWVLALGLWLLLVARALVTLPYVRARIARAHGRPAPMSSVRATQAVVIGVIIWVVIMDRALIAGAGAVVGVVVFDVCTVRRPAREPKKLGVQQLALGVMVVLVTAAGVHLA